MNSDLEYMRLALRLAQRGYGATSPNPMVGAVLVKRGQIIGRGWHHRAGQPHAEVEALEDARRQGTSANGATLFVTLEPCCTQGRTPPCTRAILEAGIKRVVVGATDPNPRHCGRAFVLLRQAEVTVASGVLEAECSRLNQAFNHWVVQHTPFVTVKAAMTLDGKIATADGQSKWITGELARQCGMRLRQGADALLVGVNTILADDPSLTFRSQDSGKRPPTNAHHRLRRIVLDGLARTPLTAKVVSDHQAALTTIVVSDMAPKKRVAALASRVRLLVAPRAVQSSSFKFQVSRFEVQGSNFCAPAAALDLRWLLRQLGAEEVTSLLVEGGGEVNASFLLQGLAQQVAFFYAPLILGGRDSKRAVAGEGARNLGETINLSDVTWRRLGADWLMTARVDGRC